MDKTIFKDISRDTLMVTFASKIDFFEKINELKEWFEKEKNKLNPIPKTVDMSFVDENGYNNIGEQYLIFTEDYSISLQTFALKMMTKRSKKITDEQLNIFYNILYKLIDFDCITITQVVYEVESNIFYDDYKIVCSNYPIVENKKKIVNTIRFKYYSL